MTIIFQNSSDALELITVGAPHPAGNGWVSQGFTHQVTEQGVGSQETQADVGGFGEVAENRRV